MKPNLFLMHCFYIIVRIRSLPLCYWSVLFILFLPSCYRSILYSISFIPPFLPLHRPSPEPSLPQLGPFQPLQPTSFPGPLQPTSCPGPLQPTSCPNVLQPTSCPGLLQPTSCPGLLQPTSCPDAEPALDNLLVIVLLERVLFSEVLNSADSFCRLLFLSLRTVNFSRWSSLHDEVWAFQILSFSQHYLLFQSADLFS